MKTVPLISAMALVASAACASHWPSWRGGVEGAGVTQQKNLPVEWSNTKNVRWSVPLPDGGNSTPVVWADRLFITQAVAKENRRTVMCFDRADGRLLWQSGVSHTEKEETHEANPYCAASPATDGGRVIATFGSAGIHCYDFDGKELWRRDLGTQRHEWGYASSPVMKRSSNRA